MILEHAPDIVLNALIEQAHHSFSFGTPSRLEVEMAELIKQLCPNTIVIRHYVALGNYHLAAGHTPADDLPIDRLVENKTGLRIGIIRLPFFTAGDFQTAATIAIQVFWPAIACME